MRTTPIPYLTMEEALVCLQVVKAAYPVEANLDKKVKLEERIIHLNKRIHALEVQAFEDYKAQHYAGNTPEYNAWLKEVNGW
jgi:hypothetical protein